MSFSGLTSLSGVVTFWSRRWIGLSLEHTRVLKHVWDPGTLCDASERDLKCDKDLPVWSGLPQTE